MEGASANPSSSQWTKLLRLYGPASLPDFPGRARGGPSPCLLPPATTIPVPREDASWNSLNVVNKNPTRKRSLWTDQEKTSPLGRHSDLSTSFSSLLRDMTSLGERISYLVFS